LIFDKTAVHVAAPYLLFGAQNPAHPWWKVAELVVERLIGFRDPLLPGGRVALVTPPDLQGARANPIEVGNRALDVGITTPSTAAHLAREGAGIYSSPMPGLRALAAFPHIDCIVFAVAQETGLESLEQLVEERYPLRLVTGRRSAPGNDDVLTFAVEEVLRAYGTSYADIESWGGTVIYGGPTHIGGSALLQGEADALFHEARTQPIWREIADARPMRFLSVREDVRNAMRERYGFGEFTIEPGDYRGVEAPVPTVDFSGWLLFCRDDLPYDQAYAIAQACAEIGERGDELPADVRRSLRMPIEVDYLFRETAIPLHPGAEAFAREHGHLSQNGLSGAAAH
jgi:TRAP-type uncharacterized transport system substrate-binding protein